VLHYLLEVVKTIYVYLLYVLQLFLTPL
jgi:hypothetical protein